MSDPLIGQRVAGRYEVLEHLGEGGMGSVYRARHVEMGREVALKLLHPEHDDDPEVVARFDRELRASTRIEHANTVRVYDHGQTEEGDLFLAMELLRGRSLRQVLKDEGPLPPERAAVLAAQVARGLAAAHAQGVIHRDLKTENAMVVHEGDREQVKVLDFGLARFDEGTGGGERSRLTSEGVRVGSPISMAPEYIATFKLDERSDLYGLGVVLFELLTGQPPFRGTPDRIFEQHLNAPVPRPSEVRGSAIPAWLEAVVLALLQKDPARRPASAAEVARRLEEGLAQPPAEGAHRLLLVGCASAALLATLILLGLVFLALWS